MSEPRIPKLPEALQQEIRSYRSTAAKDAKDKHPMDKLQGFG